MDTPTDIVPFSSERFGTIRLMCMDGEPWFVARDVCDVLGLNNTTEALRNLDDDEKGNISNSEVAQNGGRSPLIVSEPGFYKLVMRSRKPESKAFQRWVTHEVLPAIRRDGGYMARVPEETPEQTMARALIMADATIKRQSAELDAIRPKALVGEAVQTSKASYSVTEAVRYVAQLNPAVKRQQVFDELRSTHMMVMNGTAPTRKGIDTGRMVAVLHEFRTPDGERVSHQRGRLTGKGLAWLVARFAGEVA